MPSRGYCRRCELVVYVFFGFAVSRRCTYVEAMLHWMLIRMRILYQVVGKRPPLFLSIVIAEHGGGCSGAWRFMHVDTRTFPRRIFTVRQRASHSKRLQPLSRSPPATLTRSIKPWVFPIAGVIAVIPKYLHMECQWRHSPPPCQPPPVPLPPPVSLL